MEGAGYVLKWLPSWSPYGLVVTQEYVNLVLEAQRKQSAHFVEAKYGSRIYYMWWEREARNKKMKTE